MQRFQALVASKGDSGQSLAWQELGEGDLMEGDVLVRVSHSTVNYKDGLAVTGKAPVIRRWPMIPGIDFAGNVVSSTHPEFKAGRRGAPERLGRGRDALRRLRADGARQGRLAAEDARAVHARRVHGDRHGRIYGHAVRAGAGAERRQARQRARCW